MALFGALGIAGSGLSVHRQWLDAISDNIANINNASPTTGEAFRARFVVAQSVTGASGEGGGSRVSDILYGNAEGRLVFEPSHPLADAEGMVRYPDIDLADQMTQMIMAQRAYQANLAVVDRARNAYEAALQLGRY
jgi:flagellar basal-body rod protein FlgC